MIFVSFVGRWPLLHLFNNGCVCLQRAGRPNGVSGACRAAQGLQRGCLTKRHADRRIGTSTRELRPGSRPKYSFYHRKLVGGVGVGRWCLLSNWCDGWALVVVGGGGLVKLILACQPWAGGGFRRLWRWRSGVMRCLASVLAQERKTVHTAPGRRPPAGTGRSVPLRPNRTRKFVPNTFLGGMRTLPP